MMKELENGLMEEISRRDPNQVRAPQFELWAIRRELVNMPGD